MPDQPAEGGAYDAPADTTTLVDEAFADADAGITDEAPAEATSFGEEMPAEPPCRDCGGTQAGTSKYEGEGVYMGASRPRASPSKATSDR